MVADKMRTKSALHRGENEILICAILLININYLCKWPNRFYHKKIPIALRLRALTLLRQDQSYARRLPSPSLSTGPRACHRQQTERRADFCPHTQSWAAGAPQPTAGAPRG